MRRGKQAVCNNRSYRQFTTTYREFTFLPHCIPVPNLQCVCSPGTVLVTISTESCRTIFVFYRVVREYEVQVSPLKASRRTTPGRPRRHPASEGSSALHRIDEGTTRRCLALHTAYRSFADTLLVLDNSDILLCYVVLFNRDARVRGSQRVAASPRP